MDINVLRDKDVKTKIQVCTATEKISEALTFINVLV